MTDRPPARPFNPLAAHCSNCHHTFSDIWAYKRHQDDCPGPSGRPARPRRDPSAAVGELGTPPTAAEQAYLDDQDDKNPTDPNAERAENARMFRAEVQVLRS